MKPRSRWERSTDGANFAATLGANVTTFSDSGRAPSTAYWYRVSASNGGGKSTCTTIASVTTPALPTLPAVPPLRWWQRRFRPARSGLRGSTTPPTRRVTRSNAPPMAPAIPWPPTSAPGYRPIPVATSSLAPPTGSGSGRRTAREPRPIAHPPQRAHSRRRPRRPTRLADGRVHHPDQPQLDGQCLQRKPASASSAPWTGSRSRK